MTVEMEKPFVWPEDPKSWKPWGREEKEAQVKEAINKSGAYTMESKRNEIAHMRDHAKKILQGVVLQKAKIEESTEEKSEAAIKEEEKAEQEELERWAKMSLLEKWEAKRSPQMLGRRPQPKKDLYL